MKIVFYFRTFSHIRPYRNVLRALSKRGVLVHAIFDPKYKKKVGSDIFEKYKSETPGFTYSFGYKRPKNLRYKILIFVREMRSYRRYLLIERQAVFYRDRWLQFLPRSTSHFIAHFPKLASTLLRTSLAGKLLESVEHAIPAYKAIRRDILSHRPDAVLIAYRNLPSRALDVDYLKAAKSLKIPTVIPVFSWDTLTTKGLIHVMPDRVLAWNKEQVGELKEHHQVPHEVVRIVGAYQFDHWLSFNTSSQSREIFCKLHGLRPEDPILLYLGFSYGKKDTRIEGGHGTNVVKNLRRVLDEASDPRLKKVQIIVRPHPMHTEDFAGLALHDTIVLPQTNTLMNKASDWQLFYDSLYHSIAACVINTTAIIDTVIQGKPGIMMVWDEYKFVQGSTHFKQFIDTGAVTITRNYAEFQKTIGDLLDSKDSTKDGRETYFQDFIQPRGKPASEVVVDEVTALIKEKSVS